MPRKPSPFYDATVYDPAYAAKLDTLVLRAHMPTLDNAMYMVYTRHSATESYTTNDYRNAVLHCAYEFGLVLPDLVTMYVHSAIALTDMGKGWYYRLYENRESTQAELVNSLATVDIDLYLQVVYACEGGTHD